MMSNISWLINGEESLHMDGIEISTTSDPKKKLPRFLVLNRNRRVIK